MKKANRYIERFSSIEDVAKAYGADDAEETAKILADLRGAKVHLAWYGYGSYDGRSMVVFERGKKLFVVDASHCSCCGLEGQWAPSETTWQALAMRNLSDGYTGGSAEAHVRLHELCAAHGAWAGGGRCTGQRP